MATVQTTIVGDDAVWASSRQVECIYCGEWIYKRGRASHLQECDGVDHSPLDAESQGVRAR